MKPNVPLLRNVVDHIEAHPEEWNQENWATPCGTAYCFAGHALIMSGHAVTATVSDGGYFTTRVDGTEMPYLGIVKVAAEELGISTGAAHELFDAGNSWKRIRSLVEEQLSAVGEHL